MDNFYMKILLFLSIVTLLIDSFSNRSKCFSCDKESDKKHPQKCFSCEKEKKKV